jgi:excinuclease ABC subunit B
MTKFKLNSPYKPIGDQIKAISTLSANLERGQNYQTMLGVTGSGKTFTMANVIEQVQRPTLVISHNKTLAAQIYQELKSFFPENAVSYFVSYYDYYQPEAYIPSTDTYIEKDSDINEMIDKLRLAATTNLLTRKDTIVVATVSCIYNIGSPVEYGQFIFEFSKGVKITREQIIDRIVDLQYERSDFGFNRGTFRVRGDTIDIYPAYQDDAFRIEMGEDSIREVATINPMTGATAGQNEPDKDYVLYPAKHFMTNPETYDNAFANIKADLEKRVEEFTNEGKILEAHRIQQKVNYDLEMIKEVGYVKGVENYSRYFDGRKPGDPPYALIDYFNVPYKDKWLLIVDESHITFPQIRGMFNGDQARKQTLINYGFRLPSALDNRPLRFEEFVRRVPNFIASSATPNEWELSMSNGKSVELLVRPTGIPDPEVEIKPVKTQVADVQVEIKKQIAKKQRTLVTTLTKRTAEDLTEYLAEKGIKVQYLHSDVATLERTDILDDLRQGKYDVLVGINLLREGLDLPEVSLVAILDADKEGFLRSDVTLIQTMGRAARHVEGRVIMYADKITGSMDRALKEVKRRREYQLEYNKEHDITPESITKPLRDKLAEGEEDTSSPWIFGSKEPTFDSLPHVEIDSLTPMERKKLVKNLTAEMRIAAQDLNFELAAKIRDKIKELG